MFQPILMCVFLTTLAASCGVLLTVEAQNLNPVLCSHAVTGLAPFCQLKHVNAIHTNGGVYLTLSHFYVHQELLTTIP